METKNPRYSDNEKQTFIEQWKQSGKTKVAFCKEKGIGYCTFNGWVKREKKKIEKSKSSFVALRIKNSAESIFAQIILKNGTTVNIYQAVDSSFVSALLKA
jgi:transposase-like protein